MPVSGFRCTHRAAVLLAVLSLGACISTSPSAEEAGLLQAEHAHAPSPAAREKSEVHEFLVAVCEREGIAPTSEAILSHYGLADWQGGDAVPPIEWRPFNALSDFLDILIISRDDWGFPSPDSGATVDVLFLGDPTDDDVDAVAMRVTGTFKQVADAVASLYTTGYTATTVTAGGRHIRVHAERTGEAEYVTSVYVDNVLVWQK